MNENRVGIEEMCMQDIQGLIYGPKDEIDAFKDLCEKQLPSENRDDWSESRHY